MRSGSRQNVATYRLRAPMIDEMMSHGPTSKAVSGENPARGARRLAVQSPAKKPRATMTP